MKKAIKLMLIIQSCIIILFFVYYFVYEYNYRVNMPLTDTWLLPENITIVFINLSNNTIIPNISEQEQKIRVMGRVNMSSFIFRENLNR